MNLTTPLLIIGAALPRTATTSIAVALEQLGYKVYHPTTQTKAFGPIWDDICESDTQHDSEKSKQALDRFVQKLSDEGFNATLNQPSCFVFEQLMQYHPNAKILQTQRDAGSWARSMVETSYKTDLFLWQPPFNQAWNETKGPYGYWSKKQLGFRDQEIHPSGVPANSNPYNHMERKSSISLASCKVAYHRYQNKIRRKVPADKLVPFDPKDGWEPLCQHFLIPTPGISCPKGDFPQINTRISNNLQLDIRRKASARVHLYKILPALSDQEWLVHLAVFGMKRRRNLLSFFQKLFPRRGKTNDKSQNTRRQAS